MKYDLKIYKATKEEKDMIKDLAEKYINENNYHLKGRKL